MTLTTTFAIAAPTNPELVFLLGRRIIGIPAEQPFDVTLERWGDWLIRSKPDGFDSALLVWHRHGEPLDADDDDNRPDVYVTLTLDTAYGVLNARGEDACELHRRITAELGEWCDWQGLPWLTRDETHHAWRERTPAFASTALT